MSFSSSRYGSSLMLLFLNKFILGAFHSPSPSLTGPLSLHWEWLPSFIFLIAIVCPHCAFRRLACSDMQARATPGLTSEAMSGNLDELARSFCLTALAS